MTSEEPLVEEKRMKDVMDGFLANHMRFIETANNFNMLGDFMDKHNLELTAANLHFAYESLAAAGELQLVPFARPILVEQPQLESPTPAQPAPMVPITARTFRMFRNGQPIERTVKSL